MNVIERELALTLKPQLNFSYVYVVTKVELMILFLYYFALMVAYFNSILFRFAELIAHAEGQ